LANSLIIITACREPIAWLALARSLRFAKRHAKANRYSNTHILLSNNPSQVTNHIGTFSNRAQETKQPHRSPSKASKNSSYNHPSLGHAEKPRNRNNEQAQAHAYKKDKATCEIHKLCANVYNSKNQTKQTREHDF